MSVVRCTNLHPKYHSIPLAKVDGKQLTVQMASDLVSIKTFTHRNDVFFYKAKEFNKTSTTKSKRIQGLLPVEKLNSYFVTCEKQV